VKTPEEGPLRKPLEKKLRIYKKDV